MGIEIIVCPICGNETFKRTYCIFCGKNLEITKEKPNNPISENVITENQIDLDTSKQRFQMIKILKIKFNAHLKDLNLSCIKFENETKIDIDTLMRESDFITIHAAATEENDNLISEEQIKLMKSNAFLINLAKGSLVDYEALYKALKEKRIAGAALDVFPLEPIDEDNEFLELDNVIVLPHIGGNTTEVILRQSKLLLDDIVIWLDKGIPSHVLNPEVYKYLQCLLSVL